MAAVTYYMVTRDSDNMIIWYGTNDPSGEAWVPEDCSVVSASFDSDPGADVQTPKGHPETNVTFVAPNSYGSPPGDVCIKMSWQGDGSEVGGMREMSADGVNEEILRLQKWDYVADQAINSGSESYRVCVSAGSAKPSAGKVSLVNGTIDITFTPASTEKGIHVIEIIPVVSGDPITKEKTAMVCFI